MIISRTPLRLSFIGGGSDLAVYYQRSPGSVVSTALNMYIYITVNKKFDDLIRVSYSKTEMVQSVKEVEHNIIREALKIVGIEKGVDIVYMGDIPLGTRRSRPWFVEQPCSGRSERTICLSGTTRFCGVFSAKGLRNRDRYPSAPYREARPICSGLRRIQLHTVQ